MWAQKHCERERESVSAKEAPQEGGWDACSRRGAKRQHGQAARNEQQAAENSNGDYLKEVYKSLQTKVTPLPVYRA